MRTILLVAAVGGIGTFVLLNALVDDTPDKPERDPAAQTDPKDPATDPKPDPAKTKQPGFLGTRAEERRDLPALSSMSSEGLTVGCEGLPQVVSLTEGAPPQLAAIETCRFAYGVWEFSPNKVFRFVSTCKAFGSQTLVGAYEIDHAAGVVRMSPLVNSGVQLVSTFEVERPSKMTTVVSVGAVQLQVNQKVTIMRPGMDADAFVKGLAPKNQIELRGAAPEPSPAPPPAPDAPPPPSGGGAKDPVLELLKGS